ncbi:MAG TPA: hypothetical protein VF043_36210 [Ktedonobacteraceae bacterium]
MSHAHSTRFSWQGSLYDLAAIMNKIRGSHMFGRLTLRNMDQPGVAHLYFRAGKLVHILSSRGDANATLVELQRWRRATARLERGTFAVNGETISQEQEQAFDILLVQLQRQGIIAVPKERHIVEGGLVASSEAKQLITSQEWRVLVEGTRRVSLAVAHLIGPQEALAVLRDILEDCSSAFPAFSSLQIASSGYLSVADTSQLDHMPRQEVLEGFAALISTCQFFCASIIDDQDAHKLMIQSLSDVGPALVSLGVFSIDYSLLSSRTFPERN